MDRLRRYGLIVAGGQGLRMGGDVPKQFLLLGGLPVLMHTLYRIAKHVDALILVLPEEHHGYWRKLCEEYHFSLDCTIVRGGDSRFASVHNGLQLVPDGALVAVHDGVRPFVGDETIESCFVQAAMDGAAAPYRPLTDSLRYYTAEANHSLDRGHYVTVQTPQVFRSKCLKEAYDQGFKEEFTDDCSVYESYCGRSISLVLGNVENIKLTTPFDLFLAEQLILSFDRD